MQNCFCSQNYDSLMCERIWKYRSVRRRISQHLTTDEGRAMYQLSVCIATILVSWVSAALGATQMEPASSPTARDTIMTDRNTGVSFLRIGQPAGAGEKRNMMYLQSSTGRIKLATAGVSISPRLFVDLSGSFGGSVYLDEPNAASLLKNIVDVDTIDIYGLRFRREYWAVYAGMGQWEGIINCSALHNNQYYVLSLNADISLGKPGEVVEGETLNAESLRTRLLEILNDNQESVVRRFYNLLASLQILNSPTGR